ncbi:deoxyguanosinetriphosphate triphosphohydrolase [Candidatus Margulisiibacteriota bacterium]
MNVRREIEERENKFLSPYAAKPKNSKGRTKPEKEDEIRTCFQIDRDRILHCKTFRRLKHKTQVFLSPVGDHFRTRLTHTIEVSQIARTIAKSLNLNEDLTEAIALGHDLGHTPFGHAGEDVLDNILKRIDGAPKKHFQHNEQSIRVAEVLERGGKGLNLTWEVIDGILHHPQKDNQLPATLEGQIVRYSDHIAYIRHDIEDAIQAGVITEKDLPEKYMNVLGKNILDVIIPSIIKNSKEKIKMDKKVEDAMNGLYNFLYKKVYTSPIAKSEEAKIPYLLTQLFKYYQDNPDKIPGYKKSWKEADMIQNIIDFIAGMTDRYATDKFTEIFVPNEWHTR